MGSWNLNLPSKFISIWGCDLNFKFGLHSIVRNWGFGWFSSKKRIRKLRFLFDCFYYFDRELSKNGTNYNLYFFQNINKTNKTFCFNDVFVSLNMQIDWFCVKHSTCFFTMLNCQYPSANLIIHIFASNSIIQSFKLPICDLKISANIFELISIKIFNLKSVKSAYLVCKNRLIDRPLKHQSW